MPISPDFATRTRRLLTVLFCLLGAFDKLAASREALEPKDEYRDIVSEDDVQKVRRRTSKTVDLGHHDCRA